MCEIGQDGFRLRLFGAVYFINAAALTLPK
jgi:hypothetical protein